MNTIKVLVFGNTKSLSQEHLTYLKKQKYKIIISDFDDKNYENILHEVLPSIIVLDVGKFLSQFNNSILENIKSIYKIPHVILFENEKQFSLINKKFLSPNNHLISPILGKELFLIFKLLINEKSSSKKIENLNKIIRSVRNIRKLFLKEKNTSILIQKICETLVVTRGYKSAWIALTNNGKDFTNIKHSGVSNYFKDFKKFLSSKQISACIREALSLKQITIYEDSTNCLDCPLTPLHENCKTLTAPIVFINKIYGVVSVNIQNEYNLEQEEINLFLEIIQDIAFILHDLELEDERNQTKNRYKQLFEHMISGVSIYEAVNNGKNFIFKEFNKSAEKIEKISREEVIGKTILEVFPGIKKFGLFKLLQEVNITGEKKYLPSSLYEDERIKGWRENFVYKLPSGELISIFNDTSKRKLAEDALHKSETKYRDTVESIPVGIVELDENGTIIFVNKAFEKIMDIHAQDIMQKLKIIDLPSIKEAGIEFYYKGLMEKRISFEVESPIIKTSKGKNLYLHCTGITTFSKEKIVSYYLTFTDITQQKIMEKELTEREKYYQEFNEFLPLPLFESDTKGTITYANKAALNITGRTQQEISKGINIFSIVSNKDKRKAVMLADKILSGSLINGEEFLIKRTDGTVFPGYVNTRLRSVKRGGISGFIFDLTEIKKIEENLKLEETRIEAQLKLERMGQESFEKITNFSLEQIVNLTGSNIGYLAFLNENKDELTFTNWSSKVKNLCKIKTDRNSHPINSLGLLGEAVKQKKPIITNDYSEENILKKGLPQGHLKIKRHLNIPIFDNDEIIAVAGVANKRTEYNNNDIQQIQLLMRRMWSIIRRKKTEDKLRKSEEKFRSIFNNSVVGFYRTTPDGKIIWSNDTLVKMLGYNSFEEMSKIDLEKGGYGPDYPRERFKDLMTKYGQIKNMEYSWKINTGKYMHISENAKAIYDGNNNIIYYDGTVEDISQRKKAEEKLKLSEERFKKLSMLTFEGILISRNGIVFDVNESFLKLNQFSRGKIIGKKIEELFIPEQFKKVVAEQLKMKNNLPIEIEIIKKDGSKIPIEMESREYKERNLTYVVTAIRDISRRKKAETDNLILEKQLTRSRKLETIGTLAGGIAHDFNNMLTPILGYAELSLSRIDKNNSVYNFMKQIYTAANRAKDLIYQILTFSRQIEKEKKPIKLQLIIKEALKLLNQSIPSTIQIIENINDECPNVLADATQMHQVVMNLCINAFHAMEKKGGTLTIVLKQTTVDSLITKYNPNLAEGNYLELVISDTGIGMSEETIERIFEPFFTTKETDKGTGMGLSTVHGIIRGLSGDIRVYSKVNSGSTFIILLPILQDEDTINLQQNNLIKGGKETCMIVDDEEIITNLLEEMLSELGYKTVTKNNSVEALKEFLDNPEKYDFLLTDLTMPNLTGLELVAECRKVNANLPVLLITGYGKKMTSDMYEHYGIQEVLNKPVSLNELSSSIRKILDN